MFPTAGLPPVLQLAVALNPLGYGVAGMRQAFAGGMGLDMPTDLAVLGSLALILLGISSFLFSRIEA